MELIVCKDEQQLARDASTWCRQKIQNYQAQSMFLPAGRTPIPLYQLWENKHPPELNAVRFLQVDDVLTGPNQFCFREFFKTHLPSYQSQMDWIETCESIGSLAVLGLGLNGHIAFHEPELPSSFWGGCVRLSDSTCRNLQMSPPQWGISYGLQAFLRSKAILLMVSGYNKRDVMRRFLQADPAIPAARLLAHENLTVMVDELAYAKV